MNASNKNTTNLERKTTKVPFTKRTAEEQNESRNRRFYATLNKMEQYGLVSGFGYDKGNFTTSAEVVISAFTKGNATSKKQLTPQALDTLLSNMSMRVAIIDVFLAAGMMTVANALSWVNKYGVNGKKLHLNQYDNKDLYMLLQNAKKVAADKQKADAAARQ
jgi:hypothetical protein